MFATPYFKQLGRSGVGNVYKSLQNMKIVVVEVCAVYGPLFGIGAVIRDLAHTTKFPGRNFQGRIQEF